MSRDLNDPRVRNVLEALESWLADDGEIFDPKVVGALLESAALGDCRPDVVRAVITTLVRECDEHTLDQINAQADKEREFRGEYELKEAASRALVAIGMDHLAAYKLVDQLARERETRSAVNSRTSRQPEAECAEALQ